MGQDVRNQVFVIMDLLLRKDFKMFILFSVTEIQTNGSIEIKEGDLYLLHLLLLAVDKLESLA